MATPGCDPHANLFSISDFIDYNLSDAAFQSSNLNVNCGLDEFGSNAFDNARKTYDFSTVNSLCFDVNNFQPVLSSNLIAPSINERMEPPVLAFSSMQKKSRNYSPTTGFCEYVAEDAHYFTNKQLLPKNVHCQCCNDCCNLKAFPPSNMNQYISTTPCNITPVFTLPNNHSVVCEKSKLMNSTGLLSTTDMQLNKELSFDQKLALEKRCVSVDVLRADDSSLTYQNVINAEQFNPYSTSLSNVTTAYNIRPIFPNFLPMSGLKQLEPSIFALPIQRKTLSSSSPPSWFTDYRGRDTAEINYLAKKPLLLSNKDTSLKYGLNAKRNYLSSGSIHFSTDYTDSSTDASSPFSALPVCLSAVPAKYQPLQRTMVGKKKCIRFTAEQKEVMESMFLVYSNPEKSVRANLANQIGLSFEQVSRWFITRRNKDKILQKRQALQKQFPLSVSL